MKQVVVVNNFNESDIRPNDLFGQYVSMTEQDCRKWFRDASSLSNVCCPACNANSHVFAFERFGLSYNECQNCRTLFLSPRPTEEQLAKYDKDSAAMQFFREKLMPVTANSRIEHIIIPRIDWMIDTVRERIGSGGAYVDFGTRFEAVLKEVKALSFFDQLISVNLEPALKDTCKEMNIKCVEGNLKEIYLGRKVRVVTLFDALARVFNPRLMIQACHRLMEKSSLLFCTSLSSSGFDIQLLWDKARNILPRDQLNILSVEGLTALLESEGFRIIELSTPGQLDVELVRQAWKERRIDQMPRFLEYLFRYRKEEDLIAFQNFLQQIRLSSHVRVVAEKV